MERMFEVSNELRDFGEFGVDIDVDGASGVAVLALHGAGDGEEVGDGEVVEGLDFAWVAGGPRELWRVDEFGGGFDWRRTASSVWFIGWRRLFLC